MTQLNSSVNPTHSNVLRRYTPPTCTLEIAAKSSALSRWVGQPTLKHLRFKLSFDDPRVSEDQWMTLQGDRTQLEALSEAVTTYVQGFLNQSHRLVMQTMGTTEGTAIATLDPPLANSSEAAHPTSPHRIALQPKGLLAHTLLLGTLATDQTGPTVSLTSTQLADLAAALDEYAADVRVLPTLAKSTWMPSSKVWGQAAAGVLVVVGLSASVLNGLNRSPSSSAPQTSQGASSSDQRVALQPLPSVSPAPNSLVSPPGTPLSTPSPTANLPIVPPAPPIGTTQPSTSPTIAPNPAGTQTTVVVPQTPPSVPPQVAIVQVPAPALKPPDAVATNPQAVPVPPIVDQLGSMSAAGTSASPRSDNSAESSSSARKTAPPRENSQAQATAIKAYFQGKWKPPSGLESGLEYVLEVDADGELRSVQERNESATVYRQQAGLPAIGEPIAPPAPDGKSSTIFLRLDPDGGVQVIKQTSGN